LEGTLAGPQHSQRRAGLLRQSAVVFAGSTALGVCGFLFQMLASRRLGVDEYGSFYVLLSLIVVAGVPAALVSPVIARYAAEFAALHDDSHLRGLMTDVSRWALAGAATYVLLSCALAVLCSWYLHVPAWTLPIAGIVGSVALATGAFRAVAQGTQSFAAFAISSGAEGVAKVGALALFVMLGLGLLGGLLSLGFGAAVGLAAALFMLIRRYGTTGRTPVHYDWRRIARSTAGAASITSAMALVGTVDVILVKHYFDAHAAGLYAAAALGGKILLFLVGFVPTVLLPRATERHARGERSSDALWMGIAVLAVVAVAGGIAFHYFGIVILHVLVGTRFDASVPLLLPYGLAMLVLGLSNVLGCYGIATHRLAFAAPLAAGMALTLGTIAVMHPSLSAVVRTLLIGNLLTCVAVAAALFAQRPAHAGARAA
jgi:O-antigen/teichoic acid export membrane protein